MLIVFVYFVCLSLFVNYLYGQFVLVIAVTILERRAVDRHYFLIKNKHEKKNYKDKHYDIVSLAVNIRTEKDRLENKDL